jgi:hypothetical protein
MVKLSTPNNEMDLREATDKETEDYLNGYATFDYVVETEHGLLVGGERVIV